MSTSRHNEPVPRRAIVPRRVRFLEIEAVVVGCTWIGATVFFGWVLFPPGDPRNGILNPYMGYAFPFYMIVRWASYGVRTRRKLNRHAWLLCPTCEHDLRGLEGDPLICPECGREWTAEQIRRSWEKWGP